MITRTDIADFLAHDAAGPILDARAPAEFADGHIPGALSFPIFTDQERKLVGTAYKQQGHDKAVLLGLELFGPKMAQVAKRAQKLVPGRKVRLHCWRGGLRSGTMAWLLELAGFDVTLLDRGYKAYRQLVLQTFERPLQLLVLGGMTGSGKTELLQELRQAGEQVLDLETLAHHKGSSFGAIGQEPQPSIEQFENHLAQALLQLDPARPVWVEDENNTIGKLVIPKALYAQMKAAPVVAVQVPADVRVTRLTAEYCQAEPELLRQAVQRISKRLGGLATKQALEAIDEGRMADMVQLALHYYDRAYQHLLNARQPGQITSVPLSSPAHQEAVPRLLQAAEKALQWHPAPAAS